MGWRVGLGRGVAVIVASDVGVAVAVVVVLVVATLSPPKIGVAIAFRKDRLRPTSPPLGILSIGPTATAREDTRPKSSRRSSPRRPNPLLGTLTNDRVSSGGVNGTTMTTLLLSVSTLVEEMKVGME